MTLLKKTVRKISLIGTWFGMSVLILMMLLIVANIIMRSFGRVIAPTYELVELAAGVAVSFCIIYVTLEKGNIIVDILLSKLPKRLQAWLQVVTSILGLGTWVLIATASIDFANKQWRLGEMTDLLDIPIAPIRYIWIIALIILCLLILIQLIEAIRKVVDTWTRS